MICPYCGSSKDKVIDSRATDGGAVIRRRRECLACTKRYTTYERVEQTRRLMVVKKDGSRVPLNGGNILRGIQAACGKRPIAEEIKERLVREIEDELQREYDREVQSIDIGLRVAQRLADIDRIAYVRYISEYHEFNSLEELAQAVRDAQARPAYHPDQQDLFPDS